MAQRAIASLPDSKRRFQTKCRRPFRHHLKPFVSALLVRASCISALLGCAVGTASASWDQAGIASIYAYSGTRTASGGWATPSSLTAAHRSLPFGTLVRVTNERNRRSVVVRITDRGPFVRGRVIDVTPAAAHVLGFSGLTKVSLTVVGRVAGTDRHLRRESAARARHFRRTRHASRAFAHARHWRTRHAIHAGRRAFPVASTL